MSFRFVSMATMQHSLQISLSLSPAVCRSHSENIIVHTFIDILSYFLTWGISPRLVSNPAWPKFDTLLRDPHTESYKSFNVAEHRTKIHWKSEKNEKKKYLNLMFTCQQIISLLIVIYIIIIIYFYVVCVEVPKERSNQWQY